MIQVTRHFLDTCGCIRLFQWDSNVPADQRVETPIESFTNSNGVTFNTVRCNEHQIQDINTWHTKIINENKLKNNTLGIVFNNFSKLRKTDSDGNEELDMSKVSWNFDKDRKLEINIPSLTTNEKTTLNSLTSTDVKII